jgi:hypothetical protein
MLALVLAAMTLAQRPPRVPSEPEEIKLPDGRSQMEEILKADHQQSLRDAGELLKLSEALKIDLEKNDRHVLSVGTLKKLDEIEKLAKKIRGRLKRY